MTAVPEEEEGLLQFLKKVSKKKDALDAYVDGGAKKVLDEYGQNLSRANRSLLEDGTCAEICAALNAEQSNADVTAHHPSPFGPCWVLVG